MLFESDKVMFEIYRETEYTGPYRVVYFTELQDHNKESEINHALAGEHFFDGFIKNFGKDEAKEIISSLLGAAEQRRAPRSRRKSSARSATTWPESCESSAFPPFPRHNSLDARPHSSTPCSAS